MKSRMVITFYYRDGMVGEVKVIIPDAVAESIKVKGMLAAEVKIQEVSGRPDGLPRFEDYLRRN